MPMCQLRERSEVLGPVVKFCLFCNQCVVVVFSGSATQPSNWRDWSVKLSHRGHLTGGRSFIVCRISRGQKWIAISTYISQYYSGVSKQLDIHGKEFMNANVGGLRTVCWDVLDGSLPPDIDYKSEHCVP